MFLIIELGFISVLLFLIANLCHYFYSQSAPEKPNGSFFFCLSNQWLKSQKKGGTK